MGLPQMQDKAHAWQGALRPSQLSPLHFPLSQAPPQNQQPSLHLAPSLAPSAPYARSPASQRSLSSSSRALSGLTQGGMNLQVPATQSPAPAITAMVCGHLPERLGVPGTGSLSVSPSPRAPPPNWLSPQLVHFLCPLSDSPQAQTPEGVGNCSVRWGDSRQFLAIY